MPTLLERVNEQQKLKTEQNKFREHQTITARIAASPVVQRHKEEEKQDYSMAVVLVFLIAVVIAMSLYVFGALFLH